MNSGYQLYPALWSFIISLLASFISIEWEKEFEGANVEACWNNFKDKIKDADFDNTLDGHIISMIFFNIYMYLC